MFSDNDIENAIIKYGKNSNGGFLFPTFLLKIFHINGMEIPFSEKDITFNPDYTVSKKMNFKNFQILWTGIYSEEVDGWGDRWLEVNWLNFEIIHLNP